MSADWYARKLAAMKGAPPPPPVAPAPPSYPQTGPTPPPAQLPAGVQQEIVVTPDNLMAAASQWKGGKGTQTETQHCPDCGSPNYFSNASSGAGSKVYTQNGIASVSGRCYECGYNSVFGKQTGAM